MSMEDLPCAGHHIETDTSARVKKPHGDDPAEHSKCIHSLSNAAPCSVKEILSASSNGGGPDGFERSACVLSVNSDEKDHVITG